jgi:GR25 family glycosyltransferase involved in LPS biosynthesis
MKHIYVVHLQRSVERKTIFQRNNDTFLPSYTFFDAVDGQLLNIENLPSSIFKKGSQKYSNGAIGCAMTHLSLWKKCIELNEPMLILEDDAIVSHDFKNHLKNVYNMLPIDFDILQLSYNCDSLISFANTNFETCNAMFGQTKITKIDIQNFVQSTIHPSVAKLFHSFGSSAYIISPKCAQKLINRCFPLDNEIVSIPFLGNIPCYTIDCKLNAIYKELNAFICVTPFIITPHLSDEYKTTII